MVDKINKSKKINDVEKRSAGLKRLESVASETSALNQNKPFKFTQNFWICRVNLRSLSSDQFGILDKNQIEDF